MSCGCGCSQASNPITKARLRREAKCGGSAKATVGGLPAGFTPPPSPAGWTDWEASVKASAVAMGCTVTPAQITCPDGSTTFPDGTVVHANGTVTPPSAAAQYVEGQCPPNTSPVFTDTGILCVPPGGMIAPGGDRIMPNGTTIFAGGGSLAADGTFTSPGGTVVAPDGTITTRGADYCTVVPSDPSCSSTLSSLTKIAIAAAVVVVALTIGKVL